MAKRSKPRAEPVCIDRTGKRTDDLIWATILGDDVMPWDTTLDEQMMLAKRQPIDKPRERP